MFGNCINIPQVTPERVMGLPGVNQSYRIDYILLISKLRRQTGKIKFFLLKQRHA
jgi:hypothetical protein